LVHEPYPEEAWLDRLCDASRGVSCHNPPSAEQICETCRVVAARGDAFGSCRMPITSRTDTTSRALDAQRERRRGAYRIIDCVFCVARRPAAHRSEPGPLALLHAGITAVVGVVAGSLPTGAALIERAAKRPETASSEPHPGLSFTRPSTG
jgi:hypothetical protein